MQSFVAAFAAVQVFTQIAYADLPIHCLTSDAEGSWEFSLGPSSQTRSSCGHSHPDNPMREPLLQGWPQSSQVLEVELRSGGDAVVGGEAGTWTMVSDEALQVTNPAHEFLAFFGFQPLSAGDGGEHLPVMLQKRHSRCNETVMGWYRDGSRKSWGCWFGRRIDERSRSFLQHRSSRAANHKSIRKLRRRQLAQTALDWRNVSGRTWVDPPVQQSMCGGCYAVAATQMLSARHRISQNDATLGAFSAAFPLYCSEYTEGCQGGYPFLATKWSEDVGLLPENCMPWTSEGSCKLQCQVSDIDHGSRFRASNHRYVRGGEDEIIEELKQGPLAVSFKSDPALLEYTGGIWDPPDLDPDDAGRDGGFIAPTHSALLVGYGEDLDIGPYWVVQNAWGTSWGEHGSFRIRRDVARSRGFESLVVAADVIPDDGPEVLDSFAGNLGSGSSDSEGLSFAALSRVATRRRLLDHRGTALCKVLGGTPEDQDVIVRIDAATNFRGLSFGLSAGTETAVQCAGQVPDGCHPPSKPGTLPECSSLEDCECDLHGQDLPFPGMQAIAEKVVLMCNSAGSNIRILMIGLGGGAISSYIRDRCPPEQLILDNVEKDGRVAGLASKFFGFKEDDKSTLQVTDGFSAVLHGAKHSYDAVLVDCFAGRDRVPDSCRNAEFVGAAKQLLKADGLLMQNIWGRSSASSEVENDFQSTISSYTQVFGQPPHKEVAFDAPQSLEYILYGVQGQRWSSLLPADSE